MLERKDIQEVKWGIIGCGDVTEKKSGPAFNKVADSTLIAVMRRDGAKAKDYATRHGVSKWYDNANQLIDDPDVNAIYIATPPLQHEDYTLRALAAGKPVYVEKPMTLNAASAIRMKEAAEKHKVKLSVAHYRRAQPMFLKIKSLLDAKAIGTVKLVQLQMLQPENSNLIADSDTNWRLDPTISGGGLFHDLAPHQLDLMIHFFGEAVKSSGISLNQGSPHGVDDMVTGHILFKNGVVFNGSWCFSVAEHVDICEIIGNEGKISFPMFGNKVTISKSGDDEEFIFDALPHVQQPMIEQVVKYFLGKAGNPCDADQAIQSMQLMDSFTKK
ncbi:Gfo/Idh/MocA family protein [Pedobacter nyackensis]|uniref:Predicted dehydrogenase n=1 Tax=Pedobacter nyackensis TaxID=475255 RepID=A0A1W2D8A7_9SPHI|nr:Gfo/Idh/MocA family oxidoreductase [Pedobacter nyackensis]SMC93625.1 Predicted dehydrogenase [Pedobacter nyackensis]